MPADRLAPRHRGRADQDNAAGIRPGSSVVLAGQVWEVMATSERWIDLRNGDGRTRSIRPAQLADCQEIRC